MDVDRIEASTVIHRDPEAVYAFLIDFRKYAEHSKYLTDVAAYPIGENHRYELEFSWWRLQYTLHSEVTEARPPTEIRWTVRRDIDALGGWDITPADGRERRSRAPAGSDQSSLVRFWVEYDPASAGPETIDLPSFVPIEMIVDRAVELAREEAERVVRSIVRELEGEDRQIDLEITRVTDRG